MNKMTEEWALLWYQCLYANQDYARYVQLVCYGEVEGPPSQWDHIEGIDDLYEDFGPVDDGPNVDLTSVYWEEWFEPRKHLFIPSIEAIDHTSEILLKPDHIALIIPLQSTARETSKIVENYIDRYYKNKIINAAQPPKYQLHLKNGRVALGYQQVRQAVITATRDPDFSWSEKKNIKENMIKFLQRELDNLGWTLDPKAREDLMVRGVMSEERFEIFKTRINRCRRDFRALSRNAVRGRFPDITPFTSEVYDHISGTFSNIEQTGKSQGNKSS